MNKRVLRQLHRWIGVLAGLQLLAWTASGLYFTLIPIDEVRGGFLLDLKNESPVRLGEVVLISPSVLAENNRELRGTSLTKIELTTILDKPAYIVDEARYDAVTGERMGFVDEKTARYIVQQRSSLPITALEYVEEVSGDDEYRGGELPAWRVSLAGNEDASVYVGALSGKIRAVRTNTWRIFDFLWSLHIMDYEDRENFNHVLIQFMAVIGLITVLSGLALFFATLRLGKR